jgi:hypothetical protein
MDTWQISLGYDTSNPDPPDPNPHGWAGRLQYGFCKLNGSEWTDAVVGELPEPADGDTVGFVIYQLGGTASPATSPLTSDTWLTVNPTLLTLANTQMFNEPLGDIQSAGVLSLGEVSSAVFDGTFNAWAISSNETTPLDCTAKNPTETDETFQVIFQLKIGSGTSVYGHDPIMIVKP